MHGIEITDPARIASAEKNTASRTTPADNCRSALFRDRNFDCGIFSRVDLGYADFTRSSLVRAEFFGATLEAALFLEARLERSSFDFAQIQRASFERAKLRGASFEGATAIGTQLNHAELQGASLNDASLVGANLSGSQLQAANLQGADLRGAFFIGTALTAADLSQTGLQGAYFASHTQMQGAKLEGAETNLAIFDEAIVWRTAAPNCQNARVVAPLVDRPIIGFNEDRSWYFKGRDEMIPITDATIERLSALITEGLSHEKSELISSRLKTLSPTRAKVWGCGLGQSVDRLRDTNIKHTRKSALPKTLRSASGHRVRFSFLLEADDRRYPRQLDLRHVRPS